MQKKIQKTILAFLFLVSFSQMSFAQYYWVNGTGNWSEFETHWATTSGGNVFHTAPPTETDDVYFDENSFSEDGQIVALDDASSYCKSMTWTTSKAVKFDAQNHRLDILGSLVLQPQVEYKLKSIKFNSQNAMETIQSNGAYLEATNYFYGSAEFKFLDDFSTRSLWLGHCSFTTNSHTFHLKGMFRVTGSPTGDFGSSSIYCHSWIESSFEPNVNMGTSTIYASSVNIDDDSYGNIDYNNVVFDSYGEIVGSGIFNEITLNVSELDSKLTFSGGSTVKFNELTATSDKGHPFSMYVSKKEGFVTLLKESGEVNLSYVTLQDIHATGGATFNANPGVDNGNNDGWIFTELMPDNYYWVGGAGNWSDLSHWATASGGTTKYTSLPTEFDHVFFDENSFSASSENVQVDVDVSVNDFISSSDDMFKLISSDQLFIVNGDMDFTNIESLLRKVEIRCAEASNLNFGETEVRDVKLVGGGNYNFTADTKIRFLNVYGGVLNTNDHNFDIAFNFNIFDDNVLNLGASTINTFNFEVNMNSTAVINAGTSTIKVSNVFKGNDNTYYSLVLNDGAKVYGDNTFSFLEISPGAKAKFESGKTQTINGDLLLNGTSSNYISISATTDGSPATFMKTSGAVNGTYLLLKDNIATGGATFTADQSIDFGNNTGWNIIASTSRDFYWIGGAGDWTDESHWAISSGGEQIYQDVPSILDNVIFDENSFSEDGQTVSIPTKAEVSLNNMDWSKVSHDVIFSAGSQVKLNVYGSLIFGERVTPLLSSLSFLGNGNATIQAGKDESLGEITNVTFDGDGIWEFASNINTNIINYLHGTVNTNGKEIHVARTTFSKNRKKEINLGTSDYYSDEFGLSKFIDSLTLNAEQSTIICEINFDFNKNAGNIINGSINKLHFVNKDVVGSIKSNIAIGVIEIDAGKEIAIDKDMELLVSELLVKGNENDKIKLHSSEEGIQCSIRKESGEVQGEYLELQDIEAVGGATFYANNSTDLGNVKGWIFGSVSTRTPFYTHIGAYPNPTNDVVFIDTKNTAKGNYEIYNSLGEMVRKTHFEKGDEMLKISMKQLNAGIYFIKIQRGQDFYQTRIVKDRR